MASKAGGNTSKLPGRTFRRDSCPEKSGPTNLLLHGEALTEALLVVD